MWSMLRNWETAFRRHSENRLRCQSCAELIRESLRGRLQNPVPSSCPHKGNLKRLRFHPVCRGRSNGSMAGETWIQSGLDLGWTSLPLVRFGTLSNVLSHPKVCCIIQRSKRFMLPRMRDLRARARVSECRSELFCCPSKYPRSQSCRGEWVVR